MKKILLMRHSIPEKCDLPTALIPLSEEGKALASSGRVLFSDVDRCYASPYNRAFETAKLLFAGPVIVKDQLHERLVGDAKAGFWLRQYQDHDFCCPGGELLNIVKVRMKGVINEILQELADGETALVVSHAAAICSYLLNYCEIEVADAASKSRIIRFHDQEILNGRINPTDYFVLEYVNNDISAITFRTLL